MNYLTEKYKILRLAKFLPRFLIVLFFCQQGFSQSYPVTASLQIIPPYGIYLPDYCVPGSDKIRVLLLQNDLTVPAYDVRLQMTVEWNGAVIMRTSPHFRPRPITLNAGTPSLISGDDLCIYLDANAIEFSGYSRENYERAKALPEGAYKISFTAFNYRRQNVQGSNAGRLF